ncbi:amino acid ABC transporter substrate-binding protein [Caryophanon tenue]|uniref:Amino acid ABC transporter substrate-binding protein n=1 Tax=Caryophanon tenue TaxID=33978 RepID=A0A1C0YNN8_9BACL|nr:amino acid ABC transporter substrate-binding protein [Caryophanon tenue]OCS88679.1 amino acid ABC transporter substrate-binding protein [Caryophanon tenue]
MKKRKWATMLALPLALTTMLAACGDEETETTSGEEKEVLVIGIDDKFAPMGFRDDKNEIVGFDIDYARAAATEMGVEVTFQPIDWKTKESELMSGRIDLIWNGYTITDERKEKVNFTEPYLENSQVVVTLADSDITALADLADKNIGVQALSSALDAFNGNEVSKTVAEVAEFGDNVMALTDLKTKRIDAVVIDEVVANYYNTLEDGTFKILDEHLAPEQYGVGVSKDDEELLTDLQAALDTLNENGKAEEISVKWFGEDKVLD